VCPIQALYRTFPVSLVIGAGQAIEKLAPGKVGRLAHQFLFVRLKRHLGHLRNHAADRETIGANCQVLVRLHVLQFKPVDDWEDPLQERLRDLESDKIVELFRRIAVLCHLHSVESKLRFQMRRCVLGIANGAAVFRPKLRIINCDGLIDRRVAVDVRDIV